MNREKFLKYLEYEHLEIKKLFHELAPAIEAETIDDTAVLFERLHRLKSFLVTHVHNEDNVFYSDLRAKAKEKEQEALLPALDLFSRSMHDISLKAEKFFDDYDSQEAIAADRDGFVKRLKALRAVILDRIHSEEGSLFYIYRAYFFDEG